ncbi:MAG: hypothetical protein LBD63_02350 [Mycoplasmataceae bacterium]|nr:hypothetical protein [Mycoplasmataceae bacterium]
MIQEEIFTRALGLIEPWYVDRIQFDEENGQFEIFVAYWNPSTLTNDNQSHYDTRQCTWRHLDVMQYKLLIHCNVPRVKLKDGSIQQIEIPWARNCQD